MAEDIKELFEFCSDPIVTQHMTWQAHLNEQATAQFIQYLLAQYERGESADWGIVYEGILVGLCSFINWSEENRCAEIGYVLHRAYWGKGIMVEAVQLMLQYGFQAKGFNRIEARCNADNTNSERVMQKLLMTYEGTLRNDRFIKGMYRSTKIYSLLRDEATYTLHNLKSTV